MAMASAVAWGLKLRAPVAPVAAAVAPELPLQVDAQLVAQALGAGAAGAASPATQAPSSLVLVGVVADRGAQGAALIAVDGKPPKPVAVGAAVGEGWVLASVAPRRAVLRSTSGAGESVLELPAPAALLVKTP